jgi:hypothetical protein
MTKLPGNISVPEGPRKRSEATGVVHRRVEITVEREVLSASISSGGKRTGTDEHCECCGQTLSMPELPLSERGVEGHSLSTSDPTGYPKLK